MKNSWKCTAIVLIVLLATIGATAGIIQSQSSNGKYDTDEDGLIEISSLEQLNAVRYDLDGDGHSTRREYLAAFPTTDSESVCNGGCSGYELTRSLDFNDPDSYTASAVNTAWTTGTGWLPIGINDDHFNTTFNGNGHTIANLYIHRLTDLDDPGQSGLFGMVGSSGIAQSIRLLNAQVTGTRWAGALAGKSHHGATISASATGRIETMGNGGGLAGGLVGYNRGNVTNSSFSGALLCSFDCQAGGIAGHHAGAMTESYANVELSAGDNSYIGGLVGYGSPVSRIPGTGIIRNSHSSGRISDGTTSTISGGLAGQFSGTIDASHSDAVVSGAVSGGLVGFNGSTISRSYATGNVSSEGRGRAGGLTGDNYGTIRASYATGEVSGRDAGGLTGWNERGRIISSYYTGTVQADNAAGGLAGKNQGSIIASYATGTVQGESQAGGLTGSNDESIIASYAAGTILGEGSRGGISGFNSGNITWSYWDTLTSNVTSGAGEGDPSGAGGRTTSELQNPTGYTGLFSDWNTDLDNEDQDFDPTTGADNFWHFGTSRQYPALRWQVEGHIPSTPEPTSTPPETPTPTSPTTQICRQLMGTLTSPHDLVGEWTSDCQSATQGRGYARFYTFSLTQETRVTINLDSDDADTYLYLREGEAKSGDYLQENDDHEGSTSRSLVQSLLPEGTYTVEATTYHQNATGTFTLSIRPGDPGGTQPPTSGDACQETIRGDGTFPGILTTECRSEQDQDKNAKFHSLTLRSESQVTITVESSHFDTFLYLREGTARSGTSLYLNDDHEGSTSVSRIQELLSPGTYAIEVTTYGAGEAGQYTLTLEGIGATRTQECELQMTLGPGDSCQHQDFTIEVDASGTALLRFTGDRIDIGADLAVTREGNDWTIEKLP